jgi:hypothetical protein
MTFPKKLVPLIALGLAGVLVAGSTASVAAPDPPFRADAP